jgi:hypothetical protein
MTSAKNDDDVNKHVAMQVNHFLKKTAKTMHSTINNTSGIADKVI